MLQYKSLGAIWGLNKRWGKEEQMFTLRDPPMRAQGPGICISTWSTPRFQAFYWVWWGRLNNNVLVKTMKSCTLSQKCNMHSRYETQNRIKKFILDATSHSFILFRYFSLNFFWSSSGIFKILSWWLIVNQTTDKQLDLSWSRKHVVMMRKDSNVTIKLLRACRKKQNPAFI